MEEHPITALSSLCAKVDAKAPLIGVSYALRLLSKESKEDPIALEACLSLIHQVIQGRGFQDLCPLKTHLQQISIYLVEHLIPRIWVSDFKSWPEAERVSAEVLKSFYSLMEEAHGLERASNSGVLVRLLDKFLPTTADGLGWDVPFLVCLADALSITSQLGLVVSRLVGQSVQKKFGNSSKVALRMLEEAFRNSLQILQNDCSSSRRFVALVLARELVTHSVKLVDRALQDEQSEKRLEVVLNHLIGLVQLPLGAIQEDAELHHLCTFEGRDLQVKKLPTALASLFVLAATRRREQPYPTNVTVQMLDELASKGATSSLRGLLEKCREECQTFSNALGLSLLVPERAAPGLPEVLQSLQGIASQEEARSAKAATSFEEICKERCKERCNNFQGLLQCLQAVGEIVCMQCSAPDDETLEAAGQIARRLPEVLGPAGDLLLQVADPQTQWNIDFLNMDGQKAWHASVVSHVLCILGAAHQSVNNAKLEELPAALRPFVAFNFLDQAMLKSTFWPGLPDNEWQSLRHSGLYKNKLPISGNIVWAQCDCGFRYCFAECGAPASSYRCQSLGRDGSCRFMNGGTGHQFAPHQRLVAVVVTQAPHGDGWPPIYSNMK